ncbi:PREDICTED: serine carboxypeptidase-like 11 isoform X1 [Ipomoea nil]|uniref:serine carboxypeptidase-like 11 isoform X1 n=1 Tax=Ipomoea nil TaxID=35883 RepID=UPI0009017A52|nr:PREDICTED: serine carboxypeptidase-like 11 isoform X1 [Ipomoea nil]
MAVANLLRRRCCTSLPFATVVLVLGFCSSHVSLALAAARSKVEYLPGFGPLPFELETGYIGIGESEDVQLFYYFVKSESNHNVDPIMLWISGGPGCSSLFALTQELGPLLFDLPKNNGALPTLSLNPYSWTKVASFIFLDLPVGTGFSYAKSSKVNYTSNSEETSDHGAEFLRKWLADHLEYQSNSFYVGGDSFSGVTVPMVVNAISYGINIGLNPHIDLKGYFVGNAFTYPIGYIIQMTRGLDLIPDEIYKSYQECGGNLICLLNFLKIGQLTLVNFPQNILETNCFGRNEIGASYGQSSVAKRFRGFNVHALDPFFLCKGQELISLWANDDSVQEALHIRKGSIEKWVQCRDDLPFNRTVLDSRPYYAILSMKGYRSLIYSGDHDLFVCSLSTEAWTKSLGYSIIDDWRPWFMNNQIVGYTRTFSNNMTYAKIKGSGHIAPVYTPLECFIMFKRWISYEKL